MERIFGRQSPLGQQPDAESMPQQRRGSEIRHWSTARGTLIVPCLYHQLPPAGVERSQESPDKPHISPERGTSSGTLFPDSLLLDADLQAIIIAWPTLPDGLRAFIAAMAKSAMPSGISKTSTPGVQSLLDAQAGAAVVVEDQGHLRLDGGEYERNPRA